MTKKSYKETFYVSERLGWELKLKKTNQTTGLQYERIPPIKFCTLAATTEFYISTALNKKNMKCISCQHSHQEHRKINGKERQLKSLVLSTEFQFPVQKTGIKNMRHTCPLFPQHWGLYNI